MIMNQNKNYKILFMMLLKLQTLRSGSKPHQFCGKAISLDYVLSKWVLNPQTSDINVKVAPSEPVNLV